MGIAELIAAGKEFGIFEFYLPFVLMFAILYGILQRIGIFSGKEGKSSGINIIISLAASLFVMVWTPAGITLSTFFANLFGQTLVVILSIIVFIVFLTMITAGTGGGESLGKKIAEWIKWILLIAVVLAVGVFFSSGGASFFPGLKVGLTLPSFGISPQTLAIALVVILTGIIIWFISRQPGEKKTV